MKRILLLVIYGIILPAASAQNLSLERLVPQDQVVQSIAYTLTASYWRAPTSKASMSGKQEKIVQVPSA